MRTIRLLTTIQMITAFVVLHTVAEGSEPYAGMLERLQSEIAAEIPPVDDATRKSVEGAKDTAARIEAVKEIPWLDELLSSDGLDGMLAKFVVLHEATPSALAEFAAGGEVRRKCLEELLANNQLMLQMVVADGARPVHKPGSSPAAYGRAMEIYTAILKASPKAREGVLQRLALAVGLEYSEMQAEENPVGPSDDPPFLKRYRHYEKAYLDGELDPNFDGLSVWELRFVVCAPESDEALSWGREMLRNYRPDHIYTENEGWRYANIVNTDVRYGSLDVRNDRPELMGVQNILMNGGICGRRAFFARYICRAFGIPATARPSSGHGASARWSPEGWVVVLGPGWRHGWTSTRYRNDLDFLATTQARVREEEFLKVKRAYWLGDVMGEARSYAEFDEKAVPAFWNGIALATQRRIIEEAKALKLDAEGTDAGESKSASIGEEIVASAVQPEALAPAVGKDGVISIPAAIYKKTEENAEDVIAMKSFDGGLQVFLPRFFQQKPILVRGGSWRHEASLCESSTRHWRGRRPKKSYDMRGLRLAVTPDENEVRKELKLELGGDLTMEFIYVPPGKFVMGGDREEKDGDFLADTPKHEVTLTKGFYLGKYEVTQAQYAAIMEKQQGKSAEGQNHPVDGVKPYTALLFCDELSAMTGMEVRLPTEAEWEYAARAGTATRWFFGNDPSQLAEYAWFKDNADGKSHAVGQKKPNPWGFYDLYGNIAEFVRDEHHEDYYAQGPKVDPTGPLLGIHSSMEYTIEVPRAGDYSLSARVVTSNVEQSLQLAVNGAESPVTISLPFTIGMWGESEPVTVTLREGANTLHFWRDQAPQYGVALKSLTLRPAGGQ